MKKEVKLPKFFAENIINIENCYFMKPNLKDLKYLIMLYKRAIEYYAFINNMKLFKLYHNKLIQLTRNSNFMNFINNNIPVEKHVDENKLNNLLDKLKMKINLQSQEKIENNVLKINEKFKKNISNSENIINDLIQQQTINFKEKLKNKKIRNKNENINETNKSINNENFNENNTKNKIENINENINKNNEENRNINFDNVKQKNIKDENKPNLGYFLDENINKINKQCLNLYNEKIDKLLSIYNKLYNDKVQNSNKYIEVLAELNLMLSDSEDDNKYAIENIIESTKEENLKKMNEIINKSNIEVIKNNEKINPNEIYDNENINESTKELLEKIIDSINI